MGRKVKSAAKVVSNKTGVKRYPAVAVAAALLAVCLSGCGAKQATTQQTMIQGDLQEQQENGQNDDVMRSRPLSQTDYALAQAPVGDSKNLYRFRLAPEGEVVEIFFIGEYQDDMLAVYQLEDGRNYIAKINPFTMMTEIQTELPNGMYFDGGIHVMPDGMVAVCNQMNGEIYLMNESLLEYDRILLEQTDVWISYISKDLNQIFYEDYGSNTICVYNHESGESLIIYENDDPENKYGSLLGVYEADNCVLIGETDMAAGGSSCKLVRVDTGETVQSYTADVRNLKVEGDSYMAYCDVDGLTEIVFGDVNKNEPQTLAFADYSEYGCRYVDVENKIAVSQTERFAAGERQAALNVYCFDTGLRQYELNIPLSDTEFIFNYAVYLKNKGIVLFGIWNGSDAGEIYVWDLLAEQSVSEDEHYYVHKWQGENPADEEELEQLRAQAQEIGERYGVEIYIGDDVKECPTDIYEYMITDNVVRIEQSLSILDRALARYPDGMLAQLDDDYGSILRIYLAGEILPIDDTAIDTAVGVQNTMPDDTHLVLNINSVYDYESTIYHEIFHAIEKYLDMTDTAWIDAEVWDSYNPSDFSYDYDYIVNQDSFDFTYVVGGVEQEEQACFIDIYSKSFPDEDRARIMEYAMMEEKLRTGYFDYEAIRNKLIYISGQIRAGFDTTGWPEVTDWEVWIQ